MSFLIEIISLVMIFFLALFIGIKIPISKAVITNKNYTTTTYALVIFVHTVVSIWNGFYGPIYGATNDALEFHRAAVLYFDENSSADLLIPGWIYSIFLAIVYEATHQSWAIGCLISTLFFGLLCNTSVNLYHALVIHKNLNCSESNTAPVMIILLIGLIPSSIILTSITMREVFQMLFLCGLLIFSVNFIKTPKLKYLILILIALVLFISLHKSFLYYGAIYLIAFTLFQFRKSLKLIPPIFLILITLLAFGFLIAVDVSSMFAIVNKFVEGTAGSEEARAYYGLPDISANIFSILNFMTISFFNYMLRPYPWEMTSIIDLTAFAENALRVFFVWRMYVLRRYISAPVVWTLFAALLLELLWGMGTLNWGTAQRHHLVAWPLFVVSYFAVLTRYKASQASVATSNLSSKLIR